MTDLTRQQLCAALGIKAGIDVNFHDLRHSCASLLINMGVALDVIRDILGHTTVKTTERYAHLQIERQAEALGKLGSIAERYTGNYTGKPDEIQTRKRLATKMAGALSCLRSSPLSAGRK